MTLLPAKILAGFEAMESMMIELAGEDFFNSDLVKQLNITHEDYAMMREIPRYLGVIDHYGCWCYFETDHGKGKGNPVNKIDQVCKTLHDGYSCAVKDSENDLTGLFGMVNNNQNNKNSYTKNLATVDIPASTLDDATLSDTSSTSSSLSEIDPTSNLVSASIHNKQESVAYVEERLKEEILKELIRERVADGTLFFGVLFLVKFELIFGFYGS